LYSCSVTAFAYTRLDWSFDNARAIRMGAIGMGAIGMAPLDSDGAPSEWRL